MQIDPEWMLPAVSNFRLYQLFINSFSNVNIPTHFSPCRTFGLRHSQILALHRKFVPPLGQSVAAMHSERKVINFKHSDTSINDLSQTYLHTCHHVKDLDWGIHTYFHYKWNSFLRKDSLKLLHILKRKDMNFKY